MPGEEIIVVGGGLSGLAAARSLIDSGRRVRVIESEATLGGRVQSRWVDGVPVDHGFQVAFRGYKELLSLARATGLPGSDLRALAVGCAVHDGREWRRYGLRPLRTGGLGAEDLGELARMAIEARLRAPEAFLEDPVDDLTTEEYLRDERRLSTRAIDHLLRPLFGTVFLDRSLSADAGYFRYLLSVMARGPAVLPGDGLGQIGEWVAADLRRAGCAFEMGTRVSSLEIGPGGRRLTGVRAEGGRRFAAAGVVLATPARVSRELLAGADPGAARRLPTESASMVSASFRLRWPLYTGRTILLNGDPGERVVDLLCQTTNVTRPGGDGAHVLLATAVTTEQDLDRERLPGAVADLVAKWSPRYPWGDGASLIDVVVHPDAQYRVTPGVRRALPGPETAIWNLALAGDATAHPSSEGAVWAGRRAASVLAGAATLGS